MLDEEREREELLFNMQRGTREQCHATTTFEYLAAAAAGTSSSLLHFKVVSLILKKCIYIFVVVSSEYRQSIVQVWSKYLSQQYERVVRLYHPCIVL